MARDRSCHSPGRLQQIIDAVGAFVAILDPAGRIVQVDCEALAVGGLTHGDVTGTSFWEAPWWRGDSDAQNALHDAITQAGQGEIRELDLVARRAHGDPLPVRVRVSAIHGEDGALTDIVVSGVDKTSQHAEEARRALSDAEAARRLAELEALYDALPVGVALHDREMRFLRVNPRMAEIDGLPVGAHLGQKGDELLPGVDPKVTRIVKTMFDTGEPVLGLQIRAQTPSDPSVMRDFIADYYPVKLDGRVVAVGTCVREVTRENRLRREAWEAQSKLRRLLDTIPAIATIHEGPDHTVVYANPAGLSHLSQSEVIGRPMREAIPELGDAIFERMDQVLRTGEAIIEPELTVPGFNDAVFYTALLPWFHQDGAVGGVIGFGYDLTEQVRIRTALERSRQGLRSVLDCTLALVAVIDLDGRVIDVNEAIATQFSINRDAVTGRPFHDALWSGDPQSTGLVRDAVELALTGQGLRFDVEFSGGGKSGVLDLMLSPEKDRGGRVRRIIASAFDITERKEAAERIELLLQEVNHRSKNLLSLVQAVARQTRGDDLEDYRAKFQHRLAGLSAAQDLVTAHDWRDVDLEVLLRNQLGAFSKEFGARIMLEGPGDMKVNARAAQVLGMAIHELVTNAGKYGALSNDEGTVQLSWRRDGDGLSLHWLERGGPRVSAPKAKGFGSMVIDTVISEALGGVVEIDFAEGGLEWSLTGARTDRGG